MKLTHSQLSSPCSTDSREFLVTASLLRPSLPFTSQLFEDGQGAEDQENRAAGCGHSTPAGQSQLVTPSHTNHIPQVMSTDGHHNHSQSFTIIHNHSQSNIIQHYPTFAENRQMSHSQKAIKKPVDSRSLGLLCRWIQAQRRCARIGCPRNPCEVGRISWILCNKMVV